MYILTWTPQGYPISHTCTCIYLQVNGVKGPSWLSVVPCFDLVEGVSVDYMHCVLLGVCRLLLRLWLQSSNHQKLWYIGTRIPDLDARLCSIKPPSEMQRTPRSMESTLKFWKGRLGSTKHSLCTSVVLPVNLCCST